MRATIESSTDHGPNEPSAGPSFELALTGEALATARATVSELGFAALQALRPATRAANGFTWVG